MITVFTNSVFSLVQIFTLDFLFGQDCFLFDIERYFILFILLSLFFFSFFYCFYVHKYKYFISQQQLLKKHSFTKSTFLIPPIHLFLMGSFFFALHQIFFPEFSSKNYLDRFLYIVLQINIQIELILIRIQIIYNNYIDIYLYIYMHYVVYIMKIYITVKKLFNKKVKKKRNFFYVRLFQILLGLFSGFLKKQILINNIFFYIDKLLFEIFFVCDENGLKKKPDHKKSQKKKKKNQLIVFHLKNYVVYQNYYRFLYSQLSYQYQCIIIPLVPDIALLYIYLNVKCFRWQILHCIFFGGLGWQEFESFGYYYIITRYV
eukprot:TRINITY_DN10207_c0_g1_i1.p1 TRINITY_DN10207_c0_g1~~TRINITY_DN10207_c0_g1_i1.p1  ORF type:complete len:346 (-),score=-5.87 TRINITY_DN10207_c0_g1_i1:442-1392(-)